MFSNILLAVDGSDLSLRAARQGISLANSLKARVVVLTVTIPSSTDFARELAVVVPEVVVPTASTTLNAKRPPPASCTRW
jgi:nucleotide-binding universal stress UspA family protein